MCSSIAGARRGDVCVLEVSLGRGTTPRVATIWADKGEIEKEREAADGDRRRHTHSDSGVRRRLSHVRQKKRKKGRQQGGLRHLWERWRRTWKRVTSCTSRSCAVHHVFVVFS